MVGGVANIHYIYHLPIYTATGVRFELRTSNEISLISIRHATGALVRTCAKFIYKHQAVQENRTLTYIDESVEDLRPDETHERTRDLKALLRNFAHYQLRNRSTYF